MKRDGHFDLKSCEMAKTTCNMDDGVRYAEIAKYWIQRAVEAEKLLKLAYTHLHEIYDDELLIRKRIKEFLGGGQG